MQMVVFAGERPSIRTRSRRMQRFLFLLLSLSEVSRLQKKVRPYHHFAAICREC